MTEQRYTVLARKYRPQTFEDVLAQDAVATTLTNAIDSKRIAHAYLFTGPRGVGKTTMARIFAKALNCAKGPTAKPCGKCDPCREIASSCAVDVLEMDAASHTGVENVREVIIDTVALAPSRDRYKIFIIDEAHMLSNPAFNALLKTLEEPPGHVVFMLATTEAVKIPATIASRCQRFRFRPVDEETMAAHLRDLAGKEKIAVDDEAIALLAKHAGGSLRDAVSLLDQAWTLCDKDVKAQTVRDMFGLLPQETLVGLAESIFRGDAVRLGEKLSAALAEGIDPAQLVKDLRDALHALYMARLGVRKDERGGWSKEGASVAAERLEYLLQRINRLCDDLRSAEAPRTALELGLFGCLAEAADLSSLVRRLEELEERLSRGGAGDAAGSQQEGGAGAFDAGTASKGGGAAAPAGGVWRAVLASLRDKPAIATMLRNARLERGKDGGWRILFNNSFELGVAQGQAAAIEASLATAVGGPVRLAMAVGESSGAEAGSPEKARAEEAGSVPENMGWEDVASTDKAPSSPLSQAQKLLGGKKTFKPK